MEKKLLKENKKANYYLKNWQLYFMLLPMIAVLLVFNYYPMLGLQLAFKDWSILKGIWGSPWATNEEGNIFIFKYFAEIFTDPEFKVKFGNTLRISSLRLLFGFPVPIILTLLMNELTSNFFKKSVQTISYLPHFISWVIISGILISMTQDSAPFQQMLTNIFGKPIRFFSDNDLFIVMIVASSIWKGAGWGTIIYFAAIMAIAVELYEAATVDGAGRFQKLWYITLPGIMPAITINLILQADDLVHGGFDQVFNLYNEGVMAKGDILETYLYRIGILSGDYSKSTALGLFNTLIAFGLTIASNIIVKKAGGSTIW